MRTLKKSEIDLITFLLQGSDYKQIINNLPESKVQEMDDGGMGSLKFIHNDGQIRIFAKEVARIELPDIDQTLVSFSINIDKTGDIYELDVWKVDFSPLKQFPAPPYII